LTTLARQRKLDIRLAAEKFLTNLPSPPPGTGGERYWSQRRQNDKHSPKETVKRKASPVIKGKMDVVGPISLLLRDHATLKERCADAAQEGEFLEAHKCQQQALGISLAMCGIASAAAVEVALEAAQTSVKAIEVAEITSRKMKLELELGNLIAGPYTNFAMECDFPKCAQLQAEIRSLCALIDGPSQ
jgi:hypothetical protein